MPGPLRLLREVPEAEVIRRAAEAAQRLEPAARKVFLDAVEQLIKGRQRGAFAVAVAYGDDGLAEGAFDWNRFELDLQALLVDPETGDPGPSVRAYKVGVGVGRKLLPSGAEEARDAALRSAEVAKRTEHLATETAKLVRQVTEQTRLGIRRVISDGFGRARIPSTSMAARDIRTIISADRASGYLGLTETQGRAFGRYMQSLMDEDLTAAQIQRLADRKHAAMVKQRAELIAQTEIAKAAAAGREARWAEAIRVGAIKPELWVREFVTIGDDLVCPRCEAFDGRLAEVKGSGLATGLGNAFESNTGERASGPPIHPRCRCGARMLRRPPESAARL